VAARTVIVALATCLILGLTACGGGDDSATDTLVDPTANQGFPGGGGGGGQGAANFNATGNRGAMLANLPMSRRLLSGRFKPPGGFTLVSVNPAIPSGQVAYGAVRAIITSPTGVEYDVMFGPPTIACTAPTCQQPTRTIPVGTANPQPNSAVFAPDVGMSAECGYDPDSHQVGCDTVVRDEYVAVRANDVNVSTSDAVAVLRAAIAYVESMSEGP
jgi:hypothetical protein